MHCKDLLINDSCDGQAIETIRERLPQLDIVASLAFIVEPIYTIDRGALMITAKNEEILRIFDLIRKKEANGFERLFTTINVIAKEEIVRFWRKSSILKQAEKIVVLPMYVATNLSRTSSSQHAILFP